MAVRVKKLTVNHYTRDSDGEEPPSSALLEEGYETLHFACSKEGWVNVAPETHDGRFALRNNCFEYSEKPPPFPDGMKTSNDLREWGYDLYVVSEVYCVEELEEFDSVLNKVAGTRTSEFLPEQSKFHDEHISMQARPILDSSVQPMDDAEHLVSHASEGLPGLSLPDGTNPHQLPNTPVLAQGASENSPPNSHEFTRIFGPISTSMSPELSPGFDGFPSSIDSAVLQAEHSSWQVEQVLEGMSYSTVEHQRSGMPSSAIQRLQTIPEYSGVDASSSSAEISFRIMTGTTSQMTTSLPDQPGSYVPPAISDDSVQVQQGQVKSLCDQSEDKPPSHAEGLSPLIEGYVPSDQPISCGDATSLWNITVPALFSTDPASGEASNGVRLLPTTEERFSQEYAPSQWTKTIEPCVDADARLLVPEDPANDLGPQMLLESPSQPHTAQMLPDDLSTEQPPRKRRRMDKGSLLKLIPKPHYFTVPLDFIPATNQFRIPAYRTMPDPVAPYTQASIPVYMGNPNARCSWVLPVRGAPPWPGCTAASVLDEPEDDVPPEVRETELLPCGPESRAAHQDSPGEITWTKGCLQELWSYLCSIRRAGYMGLVGLSFHSVSSSTSKLATMIKSNANAPRPRDNISGNEVQPPSARPPSALSVDHIRIYVDAIHAMEMRSILHVWRYRRPGAPKPPPRLRYSRGDDLLDDDEPLPVGNYTMRDGTRVAVEDYDGLIIETIERPKLPTGSLRMLRGATLVLLDETSKAILTC